MSGSAEILTYVTMIPQHHRQTDRQLATTIPCSAYYRAVKTKFLFAT